MDAAELLGRCDFPEATGPLSLGVSGGADSTAMALLAAAAGRSFTIYHVDHGLRPESADEAGQVEKLAALLGVACEVCRVDVGLGPDLEARARAARYETLPADVCVGHTADDRAETVLLNLLRGAGPAGVAAPFDRVHRPILRLRRRETVALCVAQGIEPIADPMNRDTAFGRVAVRERLVPEMIELLGRDPVPLLNRHADLVGEMLDAIRHAASEVDPTDTDALRAAPRAVAAEALRVWLRAETGADTFVDAASIERVMAVVHGTHKAAEITGGHRVARTSGRLRIDH